MYTPTWSPDLLVMYTNLLPSIAATPIFYFPATPFTTQYFLVVLIVVYIVSNYCLIMLYG